MAIGDQNHGCVAMAVTAELAGSVHELFDFALGEIAAPNCEVFSVRCEAIGCLICHEKSLSVSKTGKIIGIFFTDCKAN